MIAAFMVPKKKEKTVSRKAVNDMFDEYIEAFRKKQNELQETDLIGKTAWGIVIDAVESVKRALAYIPDYEANVVTCGECIHRDNPKRQGCQGRRPDWYCADGRRRNG